MTSRAITIEAPKTFEITPRSGLIPSYDMELLTPMLGGGVKSWKPDFDNIIRSQSIKGHLRFWWRTMQCCNSPTILKEQETSIWGSTNIASTVRLAVTTSSERQTRVLSRKQNGKQNSNMDYEEFPDYVLFPMQGNREENDFTIIIAQKFRLTVHCRDEDREAVEDAIKLWVLFGGIGARTRRGCGSIFCQQVMKEFSSPEIIQQFIRKFPRGDESAKPFTTAPYPQLGNCRFAWHLLQGKGNPTTTWKSFLDQYKKFRQGEDAARVTRTPGNNHPGPTRWPEADAIRRLAGKIPGLHTQGEHPAGKWFPRAAYGLPILTQFKDKIHDPGGGDPISLAPAAKDHDRWPSPVILKIIKLANGNLLKICLILNHKLPEEIQLIGPDIDAGHILTTSEMPLSFNGKIMPPKAPLDSNTSPYEGIIAFLNLQET